MQVTVTGRQIDVGAALRFHVETVLAPLAERYFPGALDAVVVFARDAHMIRADIALRASRHLQLQATAEAPEAYAAFDAAAERMGKRLRRNKRRLVDHHQTPPAGPPLPAQSYVLDPGPDDGDDDGASGDGHPLVVAETETEIELLTVSEAVLRLDLGDQPALMFRNRAHGGLNMLYRRSDGHIGWIDPRGARDTLA